MNSQKRNIGILVIVLLCVVGFFVFLYVQKENNHMTESQEIQTADIASTTIVDLGGGVTTTVPKGYTVEIVKGSGVPQPIPSLVRAAVFSATVDSTVKTAVGAKITELQAVLKKDPTRFEYWIDLGMYFKVAGDHAGAKLYWDYAGKLAPTDFISFGNLGNMYAYQLKDIAAAEKYYNRAIKNSPGQVYLYIQLAESYRDVSKDMVKARATVEKGLMVKPYDEALLQLKANLQ